MKQLVKFLLSRFFVFKIALIKYDLYRLKNRKKIEFNKKQFLVDEFEKYYKFKPNLTSPLLFSEKLLWLKINFYNKDYANLTDKSLSKQRVVDIVKKDISIKTLRVFKKTSELDFDGLPNKFILKMNNGSGYIFLVERIGKKYKFIDIKDKDKIRYSFKKIKKLFKYLFEIDYYFNYFEWNYKGITPMIIAEEYLDSLNGVLDYKFFINYGKLVCFYAVFGRTGEVHSNYYDNKKNFLDVVAASPPNQFGIILPDNIDEMIEFAKKIGLNIPLVRVDLYNFHGEIKFGELTFFHQAGYVEYYHPANFDEILGRQINIDNLLQRNKEGAIK